jgi:hypothetical protein
VCRTLAHQRGCLLGSTLFLRSHRVVLNARFLPLIFEAVFSIALGLRCCRFLTALDRASCSSSSSTPVVSSARDLRPTLRQIFFSSVFFVSCLRSQPRGILATGSEPGSREAVSVSFHVCANGARGARLRGEGTISNDRWVRMLRGKRYYTGANMRTGWRREISSVECRVSSVVGRACRARWQAAATTTNTRDEGALSRSRLFRPLETSGPHRPSRPQDDPEVIVASPYPPPEPSNSPAKSRWCPNLRAAPCSRSRTALSHRCRSFASDDRTSQKRTRVWE